jgi:hypothetical protein
MLCLCACATSNAAQQRFSAPGLVELELGQGSRVTEDCRLGDYQRRAIAFGRGEIVGCIQFPLPREDGRSEEYWPDFYCAQPQRQGWTAIDTDAVMHCLYQRPTRGQPGCFEGLVFEFGLGPNRTLEELERSPVTDVYTFAVIHESGCGREYRAS